MLTTSGVSLSSDQKAFVANILVSVTSKVHKVQAIAAMHAYYTALALTYQDTGQYAWNWHIAVRRRGDSWEYKSGSPVPQAYLRNSGHEYVGNRGEKREYHNKDKVIDAKLAMAGVNHQNLTASQLYLELMGAGSGTVTRTVFGKTIEMARALLQRRPEIIVFNALAGHVHEYYTANAITSRRRMADELSRAVKVGISLAKHI